MRNVKLKQNRPSATQAEPIAHPPPALKQETRVDPPIDARRSRDHELYGSPPLLPDESEARYDKIDNWLKPSFGGYQLRFEHHLRKEMVDSIWKRQRWEH